MDRQIDVDLIFSPDGSLDLVVPQQEGVDFETASPRLAAFAAQLSVTLGVAVTVNGAPERHVHPPAGLHTHTGQRAHTHS